MAARLDFVNGQWDLPGGGQQNCPLAARCSADRSVGQWGHCLSGGGFGRSPRGPVGRGG